MINRIGNFHISLAFLAAILLSSTSCSKLGSGVSFEFDKQATDFAKSQIITNGPQAADGVSPLLIVISLQNSNNTPVVNFTPTYQVVSGSLVVSAPCTSSNSNGVSTCILKSHVPGTKRILVDNIIINLTADVVFTLPPAGRSTIAFVSSTKKPQSVGAYKFSGTIGNSDSGIKKQSGTYSFYGSLQGQESSR
ncbi:MAG: hypothetical protein EOP06_01205 [Proteobacteria bacterium]|nr:MAG: hypothetical protein EOP06_01205 [Pseudomonadota bacterium]